MPLTILAFFGATGGCTNSCLAACLEGGYACTALVRTPSKLQGMLFDRGVSKEVIGSQLAIVQGDVRDLAAVKRVVTDADVTVSGVGSYPNFQWSTRLPLVSSDSTICNDATTTILKACQDLYVQDLSRRPALIVISTAGVQEAGKPRALPLAYLPWYNWLLADPLADKIAMEDTVLQNISLPDKERGVASFTVVKPSILTNGKEGKLEDVRAGTGERPPIGYSIDRDMVGMWMFRHLIDNGGERKEWSNCRVTVTY